MFLIVAFRFVSFMVTIRFVSFMLEVMLSTGYLLFIFSTLVRSEERRVGKECW